MNKIVFIFLIIVFLLKTGNVFSNNNIFNVDNIIVTNDNNLNREQLLNKAFKNGFIKLVNKILLKKDTRVILNSSLSEIKDLVSNYQIIELDKISNRNEVKINISFNRVKINKFFYEKNILYADIEDTNVLIFPVLIENGKVFIFNKNYFFTNWEKEKNEENNNFIQYILPVENLEYIRKINSNKDNLDQININDLLSNYDLEDYLFMAIISKEKSLNVYLKGTISGNQIVKNISFDNFSIDKFKNYDLIIEKTKQEIQDIWKSQNLIDVRTPSFLNINLDIEKIDDLLKLQNNLNKIDLIENYNVLELTNNNAKIKIKYFGKITKIKKKFIDNGVEVKIRQNQWTLKVN